MNSLSEILGLETSTLAEYPVSRVGVPLSKKVTPEIPRVDLADLEKSYLKDPIIFNSINKVVEVIMSAKCRVVGSDDSVSYVNDFLDKIGLHGGSVEWKPLLKTAFMHQCIYGRAFWEVIYNTQQTKVMDLDCIDPKRVDYAKNSMQRLVLDKFSNPVGYTETIPYSEQITSLKSDPTPNAVMLLPNQIFFNPSRIAHFKLYTMGDGFYGIGLIEPIYDASNRKLKMEEALANVYMRTGFPTKGIKVGDQFHEPTKEMLSRSVDQLEEADYRSVFAIPYYADPFILESKKPEKLRIHLDHFVNEENTGVGVPSAFATWKGGETNRATLNRQEFLFKLSLRNIVQMTTQTIERYVFAKIAKLNKLEDTPRIEWGEINLEELDSKSKRLVDYVGAGLLKPDQNIEKLIREQEGLPQAGG